MSDAVAPKIDENLVTLIIDGQPVAVKAGTVLVDAAKQAGIDIPVFCYHPKMEPVGMCRMCLVEVGRPQIDRETGKPALDENGEPIIQFGPKLETGCTVPVAEGMVVRGYTDNVKEARDEVLEFLLTSHPLDCPICDKGGECPLQNLTMNFGPGQSRYIYDEKKHLEKHVPLGDLIFLDRERCIQCARCTRFQDEIVDDPVIGFSQRGRALQIVTFSEPGFDSYWSGNTTDICPVGALTTADFRFGARPWEMQQSASICNQCSVGCNITFNTRREAKSGGQTVIKRAMPRQNEWVNEIWMCDKGRFGYHYTEAANRIQQPLLRKGGQLTPVSWEEALAAVREQVKKAAGKMVTLAGGRLSNEDYFNIKQLSDAAKAPALLYSQMAGGDLTAQVGLGAGSNLADLGPGSTIVVIASDLEEEAGLWWLRLKQAAERGATLVVANPRSTKLERYAQHVVRYSYGQEAAVLQALVDSLSPKSPQQSEAVKGLLREDALKAAAQAVQAAENLVVFYGSDGTSLASSTALAQAAANLLIATGHVGRANNGLVAVWDKGNAQGAWDMGLRPSADLATQLKEAGLLYIAGADPAGDDPQLAAAVDAAAFVVVQELAMTKTAAAADVVLPALAYTERDGSYTSGERRVQRFYPAVPVLEGARADYAIAAQIGEALGLKLEQRSTAKIFRQASETHPAYSGLDYGRLAEVVAQWPIIGRDDVYYGGTTYDNTQGLGVKLDTAAERGEAPALSLEAAAETVLPSGLVAVPVTRQYDRGNTIRFSKLLDPRREAPQVVLNPQDAAGLGLSEGKPAKVTLDGVQATVTTKIDNSLPQGTALIPRSLGLPINGPTAVKVEA
ncbi:MAG: NADH-quinone oxidoreductase subunit NuoG [Anaerolineales bacterium]|nr:NADH-quinone oxidoreductase subunit NuoG [Anaerolineales bacterium]MCW5855131.1 NADH-quinone oxidoreductase subunit NuoG [Anaerolineales bacterium]